MIGFSFTLDWFFQDDNNIMMIKYFLKFVFFLQLYYRSKSKNSYGYPTASSRSKTQTSSYNTTNNNINNKARTGVNQPDGQPIRYIQR